MLKNFASAFCLPHNFDLSLPLNFIRMKKLFLFAVVLLSLRTSAAPHDALPANPYTAYFNEAYQLHPALTHGVLEAVAFTNTHFYPLDNNGPESCTGMPRALTVMGLMQDGKGWFTNNLTYIATLAQVHEADMIASPRTAILAYADALEKTMRSDGYSNADTITCAISFELVALVQLSEFPQAYSPHDTSEINTFLQRSFVIDTWLYGIINFLTDERTGNAYQFTPWTIDASMYFGENYPVLSSTHVVISKNHAPAANGRTYTAQYVDSGTDCNHNHARLHSASNPNVLSPDYGPALYNPAASCNYSSRNSTAITAVTIHDVEGSYAGCISWFQNCSAQVSAHYVVRSSDGQITQMVLEANKAWHVGSENPYTVGIEHEGYQAQTGWYTNAMYTSSAALVRDICNDNSIDPLRTGYWPWLGNTYYNQSNIPGACTKVKGHQHYPNQTHNDPGPNWDWNYFYKLVNNPAPAATVYTTASGNFYDSGGNAANYNDDERLIWTISPTNATSVTMTFNSFATENTWDYLYIYDGADINAPLIGYYTGSNSPGTITSSGGSLTMEFRSDCSTTGTGWNASWNSTINIPSNPDAVAPVTTVSINGNWQTQNFTANFAETDSGGSGLEKSFYQVIDFDGTDWRANNTQGFFSDNFDLSSINPEWTSVVGTWQINNSVLEQNDEAQSNTNIYAPLTQNLSNKYLYNWAGKIDGTGNNRRAGFHFFCDNPTGTNRGNNYFVWFRVDQSALEFYEVTNDVFTLMQSYPMTVNAGQWYDWKVVYDRTTGEINVYQDNALIGSWTDTTPYSNGQYISFRSGNCNWQINNFKVYRSRASNTPVTVTVGNCPTCELRYQNTNPNTPAGRVKSLVRDSAYNISAVSYQDVNVDWTPPTAVDTINDGTNTDIDLSLSPNTLDANWSTSVDPHSGLLRYWYAIGTTAGDSDVVAWTNNWTADTSHDGSLSLVNGQWYYVSVRAENGAGLVTQSYTSDGVLVDLTTGIDEGGNVLQLAALPNPFSGNTIIQYQLNTAQTVTISLYDMLGKEVQISRATEQPGNHTFVLAPEALGLSGGVYLLKVSAGNALAKIKLLNH